MNPRRAKGSLLSAFALMLACVAVEAQAAIIYWPLPASMSLRNGRVASIV